MTLAAVEHALEMTRVAATAAVDKLGTDLVAYDVSEQLAITDVFLVVTAANERQVGAVVDGVEEALRNHGAKPVRREGDRQQRWVLLDYLDLVIHIQHTEERQFYALERLWRDCPQIELEWTNADDRRPDHLVAARAYGVERRQPLPGPSRHPPRFTGTGAGRTDRKNAGPVCTVGALLERPLAGLRDSRSAVRDHRARDPDRQALARNPRRHLGGALGTEVDAADPELARRLRAGEDVRRSPTGESPSEVAERMAEALTEIADRCRGPLHGGGGHPRAPGRVGACRFVGLPFEMWRKMGGLSNCAWVSIDRHRSGTYWRIEAYNALATHDGLEAIS